MFVNIDLRHFLVLIVVAETRIDQIIKIRVYNFKDSVVVCFKQVLQLNKCLSETKLAFMTNENPKN